MQDSAAVPLVWTKSKVLKTNRSRFTECTVYGVVELVGTDGEHKFVLERGSSYEEAGNYQKSCKG